jgi:hypothetical protein
MKGIDTLKTYLDVRYEVEGSEGLEESDKGWDVGVGVLGEDTEVWSNGFYDRGDLKALQKEMRVRRLFENVEVIITLKEQEGKNHSKKKKDKEWRQRMKTKNEDKEWRQRMKTKNEDKEWR